MRIILFPVSSNDNSGILVDILNYIYKNKICNVINLSLGYFSAGEKTWNFAYFVKNYML